MAAAADAERIAALTQRRNERLAALAAHKLGQNANPATNRECIYRQEREQSMSRKVIITCAVTGAIHTPRCRSVAGDARGNRRRRGRRSGSGSCDRASARAATKTGQPTRAPKPLRRS